MYLVLSQQVSNILQLEILSVVGLPPLSILPQPAPHPSKILPWPGFTFSPEALGSTIPFVELILLDSRSALSWLSFRLRCHFQPAWLRLACACCCAVSSGDIIMPTRTLRAKLRLLAQDKRNRQAVRRRTGPTTLGEQKKNAAVAAGVVMSVPLPSLSVKHRIYGRVLIRTHLRPAHQG